VAAQARREAGGPETAGETAYRRLRGDVVLGRLAPGGKLGLDGLRGIYGVAIGTLREALNRLTSEGLVIAEGQRGFRVAPVSIADFREIAQLRLLLETHAMEASFAAGDLDWEGAVVGAHHKLAVLERRLLAGGPADTALWKHLDRGFHEALIAACGSTALLEAHAAVHDRYLRYQMVGVSFRGATAAEQHVALRDCALRRDAVQAAAVLAAHVEGCIEHVALTGSLNAFAPRRRGNAPSGQMRRSHG
jgi:DNA-binding GntR family transcriptional regulator